MEHGLLVVLALRRPWVATARSGSAARVRAREKIMLPPDKRANDECSCGCWKRANVEVEARLGSPQVSSRARSLYLYETTSRSMAPSG